MIKTLACFSENLELTLSHYIITTTKLSVKCFIDFLKFFVKDPPENSFECLAASSLNIMFIKICFPFFLLIHAILLRLTLRVTSI